ncbi:hypothetical protein PPNSA23_12910 [Phyllobacterium phragmitis]|uniref:Uncharacterized protein n=1 Tax=Phyllobacterium phragmitis TaxID=2670329 RepID=A0ABQ0GXG5_9HYPH
MSVAAVAPMAAASAAAVQIMALERTILNAGGTAPPSALPGISPARGEIGWHQRQPFILRGLRLMPDVHESVISPLAGEMAGRPEGGA